LCGCAAFTDYAAQVFRIDGQFEQHTFFVYAPVYVDTIRVVN
jgi:hypothetical protein